MAWITPGDVIAVYPSVSPSQALCDHVQGLAESVIGSQTEPVSTRLKAVMVDIVARFWSKSQAAATSPAGYQRERIDDYEYEMPDGAGGIGLGLTDAEKEALLLAVGRSILGSIGTTRGSVEMAEPWNPVLDTSNPDLT